MISYNPMIPILLGLFPLHILWSLPNTIHSFTLTTPSQSRRQRQRNHLILSSSLSRNIPPVANNKNSHSNSNNNDEQPPFYWCHDFTTTTDIVALDDRNNSSNNNKDIDELKSSSLSSSIEWNVGAVGISSSSSSSSSSVMSFGKKNDDSMKEDDIVAFLNGKLTNSFYRPLSSSSSSYSSDNDNRGYNWYQYSYRDDRNDLKTSTVATTMIQCESGTTSEALLLTSGGRVIDRILVLLFGNLDNNNNTPNNNHDNSRALTEVDEAILISSPGHVGSALFERLNQFVFPLDGVVLNDLMIPKIIKTKQESASLEMVTSEKKGEDNKVESTSTTTTKSGTRIFTIAGSNLEMVQNIIKNNVWPILLRNNGERQEHQQRQSEISGEGGKREKQGEKEILQFPSNKNECLRYIFSHSSFPHSKEDEKYHDNNRYPELMAQCTMVSHVFLESAAASSDNVVGYTLLLSEQSLFSTTTTVADEIWSSLLTYNKDSGSSSSNSNSNNNDESKQTIPTTSTLKTTIKPIDGNSYEYLRIKYGLPGFAREMTGSAMNNADDHEDEVNVKNDNGGRKNRSSLLLRQQQEEGKKKQRRMMQHKSGVVTPLPKPRAILYDTKASPMELGMMIASNTSPNNEVIVHGTALTTTTSALIDDSKGCYLGKEGMAALQRNKKGPRRSLYSVNFVSSTSSSNAVATSFSDNDKHLLLPKVGDKLYVEGSKGKVNVGVLTSFVSIQGVINFNDDNYEFDNENDNNNNVDGNRNKIIGRGLCLVRKSEKILNGMKKMGILDDNVNPRNNQKLLSLNGIRVVVAAANEASSSSDSGIDSGGVFGVLKNTIEGVASSSLSSLMINNDGNVEDKNGSNVLDDEKIENQIDTTTEESQNLAVSSTLFDTATEVLVDNGAATKSVVDSEAERKAKKVVMLQQRAVLAMEARRKKKEEVTAARILEEEQKAEKGKIGSGDNDEKDEEAQRKKEKMKSLKARAEAAMARRQQKMKEKK